MNIIGRAFTAYFTDEGSVAAAVALWARRHRDSAPRRTIRRRTASAHTIERRLTERKDQDLHLLPGAGVAVSHRVL
ncbi:hypothetical protein [Actinoplanes sp. NPDC026623]|uniref:hypothetical protein n=1 Tax=Actinoplanes sp. NPDC026623 TaxID=3155610 RepID=UPI0033E1D5A3